MNIEKALRNYLRGVGPKVKIKDFCEYSSNNPNAMVNVLFKLINEELDEMDDSKSMDKVIEILHLLEASLNNNDQLNRKIVARKLSKLSEKLTRIIAEGKLKFKDLNRIEKEFEKVQIEIDKLQDLNEKKDSKQYDLIKFIINETRNISYLEYTLMKMPSLANVKDKEEVPLFRNLITSYLNSILTYNEEDILYYENLITIITSQKSFNLSQNERRKCLEEVYKALDKLSVNKKMAKKNGKKIEIISSLTNLIKGIDDSYHDITNIASKYHINIEFAPEILESARLVREPVEGEMTDREVIDDYIISMDKDTALEIDDALSCKKLPNGNYLLGVHIATVLGYFPYESDIVQEAIKRTHSIYLPHKFQSKENEFNRAISIFPYDFSADKGSLIEGKRRLARTYYFEIDNDGNIVNERFVKSIITNRKQLSYEKVNSILTKGTKDEELQETIECLAIVAEKLDKRHKVTELYDKVKENTDDFSELRVKRTGSENIVYQAMLLTGSRVAKFFAENNIPLIYRVHHVNEENNRKLQLMIESLNKAYGGEQFKTLYQLIEGIYPKGWYAIEGKHEGLNLEHYCHCTSVLRRAADIIVEHALEVCYDKTPTEEEIKQLQEEIAEKIIEINAKVSPIEYFLKEYQKKYRK